ncbi:MAG: DUF5693 family protein [Candidatus Bruticola sp.]
MNRIFRNLVIFVIIGLTAALPIIMHRVQSEQRNNSAEILFDYAALNDYARRSGNSLEVILRWCKTNGVSAVAVEENSRDSLALRGLARAANYFEMLDLQAQKRIDGRIKLNPMCAYYEAKDRETAEKIRQGAAYSLGTDRVRLVPDNKGKIVELACDIRDLPVLGLGIPYDIVQELNEKYGFKVWIRPWNSPQIDEKSLTNLIQTYGRLAEQNQIEGLIFGGLRNEVYGYPKNLDKVSQLLKNTKLKIGVIELAPKVQQKGIITLAKANPDRVVRVMAVTPSHQAKLDPEAVVAMYSLGLRERGIRLSYCRPYIDGVDKFSMEEANTVFMSGLNRWLASAFRGEASTYQASDNIAHPGFTWWSLAVVLIGGSIAASLCLLLSLLHFCPSKYTNALGAVIFAVTALSCISGLGCHLVRMALALLAVTLYPILAYVLLTPIWEKAERYTGIWQAVGDGLAVMAVATSLTLYSGLLAGALLSDLNYMLSLDVFRGVKLHSLLVPLLTFIIWLAQQRRRGGLDSLIAFLETNVKLWHVVIFFIFAILAAFYLIRTGNSGGDLVVSESERALRRWLDYALGVRPRFKEFLLGNPALVLLPVFVFLRWKGCIPLAVLASAIGLASLSDTYGHIHTPMLVSLQRTVNGVFIGGFIGVVTALVCCWVKQLLTPYLAKLLAQNDQVPLALHSESEG